VPGAPHPRVGSLVIPAPYGSPMRRWTRGPSGHHRTRPENEEWIAAGPRRGVGGDQARQEILHAVKKALDAKGPLPGYDETRRRYQAGQVINATMTVGQWLDEWIKGRRKIAKSTVRGYEAHIRLYLRPHLGHLPIDRLRVVHISSTFDAIDAENEFIRAARASGDPAQRAAVKGRRVIGAATK
jgi:Phage integrase, N-terminal SAM-like domain